MTLPAYLTESVIRDLCQRAIAEDVGSGDASTLAIVPPEQTVTASFVPRKPCIVAGMPVLKILYGELSADVDFQTKVADGQPAQAGEPIFPDLLRGHAFGFQRFHGRLRLPFDPGSLHFALRSIHQQQKQLCDPPKRGADHGDRFEKHGR